MLDNYNKVGNTFNNTLKISACSGGIYKTYPQSWFKRFHLNSEFSKALFKSPHERNKYENDKDVNEDYIILQMVICGDMEVIAELITKQDFEKNLTI